MPATLRATELLREYHEKGGTILGPGELVEQAKEKLAQHWQIDPSRIVLGHTMVALLRAYFKFHSIYYNTFFWTLNLPDAHWIGLKHAACADPFIPTLHYDTESPVHLSPAHPIGYYAEAYVLHIAYGGIQSDPAVIQKYDPNHQWRSAGTARFLLDYAHCPYQPPDPLFPTFYSFDPYKVWSTPDLGALVLPADQVGNAPEVACLLNTGIPVPKPNNLLHLWFKDSPHTPEHTTIKEVPTNISAAYLLAHLEHQDEIHKQRCLLYHEMDASLRDLKHRAQVTTDSELRHLTDLRSHDVPYLYVLDLPTNRHRNQLAQDLAVAGIKATFRWPTNTRTTQINLPLHTNVPFEYLDNLVKIVDKVLTLPDTDPNED